MYLICIDCAMLMEHMELPYASVVMIIVTHALSYFMDIAILLNPFCITHLNLLWSHVVWKVSLSGIWIPVLVPKRSSELFIVLFICSETTTKDGHEGEVECMQWLYDGSILLTGGKDSTIKVWDVENE